MRVYGDVDAYYRARWGEPAREMEFSNDHARIGVLIWDPSEATMGVTIYATVGGSDCRLPSFDADHRHEFYVGLLPEADDIAGPLAMLAGHTTITGRVLDHGHFFRARQPIVGGESGLTGFFLLSSFDENGDFEPPVVLRDGRHVALLMAVPAFSSEIDFGLEHGVDELWSLIRSKDIPFWAPYRECAIAAGTWPAGSDRSPLAR